MSKVNHKYVLDCLIEICNKRSIEYDKDVKDAICANDAEFASGSAIAYREIIRQYRRLLEEPQSYND